LIVTGVGRYIGDELAEEKGLIIFNKGALILLVDNTELQKLLPFFKPKESQKPSPIIQQNKEDDFYLDPTFITDEEARQKIAQGDNEYSEDQELDEEGIGAY